MDNSMKGTGVFFGRHHLNLQKDRQLGPTASSNATERGQHAAGPSGSASSQGANRGTAWPQQQLQQQQAGHQGPQPHGLADFRAAHLTAAELQEVQRVRAQDDRLRQLRQNMERAAHSCSTAASSDGSGSVTTGSVASRAGTSQQGSSSSGSRLDRCSADAAAIRQQSQQSLLAGARWASGQRSKSSTGSASAGHSHLQLQHQLQDQAPPTAALPRGYGASSFSCARVPLASSAPSHDRHTASIAGNGHTAASAAAVPHDAQAVSLLSQLLEAAHDGLCGDGRTLQQQLQLLQSQEQQQLRQRSSSGCSSSSSSFQSSVRDASSESLPDLALVPVGGRPAVNAWLSDGAAAASGSLSRLPGASTSSSSQTPWPGAGSLGTHSTAPQHGAFLQQQHHQLQQQQQQQQEKAEALRVVDEGLLQLFQLRQQLADAQVATASNTEAAADPGGAALLHHSQSPSQHQLLLLGSPPTHQLPSHSVGMHTTLSGSFAFNNSSSADLVTSPLLGAGPGSFSMPPSSPGGFAASPGRLVADPPGLTSLTSLMQLSSSSPLPTIGTFAGVPAGDAGGAWDLPAADTHSQAALYGQSLGECGTLAQHAPRLARAGSGVAAAQQQLQSKLQQLMTIQAMQLEIQDELLQLLPQVEG